MRQISLNPVKLFMMIKNEQACRVHILDECQRRRKILELQDSQSCINNDKYTNMNINLSSAVPEE